MKGKGVDTIIEKQSILGKPPLQPIRNQPVVRQPTAYKSERSQVAKHRFASQVDVSNNLTKPITPHSWPLVRKLSFAKPYDVNAPSPSRKSPKHVSFQSPKEFVGSNDIVQNYYLEEANNKAQLQQNKALNIKPSVQQSTRLPNTANDPHRTRVSPTKSSTMYVKTMPPRSGLTWKPTGRIFTQVSHKSNDILRKQIRLYHGYTTCLRHSPQEIWFAFKIYALNSSDKTKLKDISKASSAGGKLHILKPSCERNGITPTPKESLSPTVVVKFILDSDMEGKNEESYKFPIAVQQSFNSLWSQDVRGDPDSGIGGLQIQYMHSFMRTFKSQPLKISTARCQYNISTDP
ncbi:hypothetical protein Tco_0412588 [Tanacetum coccineum]